MHTQNALIRRNYFMALFYCMLMIYSGLAVGAEKVVDLPARPGVIQRVLVISPDHPRASVILFAGGHGGLQITPDGNITWGKKNFLVRTRQMFADQGMIVAVVDAPSDRQDSPYLSGFRETPEHVTDIKAVIAWLRQQAKIPVWLVGTSRGTQSAAYAATQLSGQDGPDGLVLTSTILTDKKTVPVSEMALADLHIPVLVVHHDQDGCHACPPYLLSKFMGMLTSATRKDLIRVSGGDNWGDPCEAMAYHGFNGLEQNIVTRITDWITSNEATSQVTNQKTFNQVAAASPGPESIPSILNIVDENAVPSRL